MKRKKASRFKDDIYLLVLGFISALFLASDVRYALKSYYYPVWDEQYYMYMTSTYWRLLQHPTLDNIYQLITFQGVKQMGYPLMILPFLLAFGLKDSYFWGLFTNGILYVATIFGVYFIAKNYLSRFSSFVSAVIFSCYSWTLFHVHFTYNETASSATIVWTIYLLIKSNLFRNRANSILFGIFFGLALLTRWIAVVFIIGPLVYVFYQAVRSKVFKERSNLFNLLFLVFGTLLIAFLPYFINREWIFSYFYGHRIGGQMWQILPKDEKSQISFFSLTFYIKSFYQLGIFFFTLFIAGFLLALKTSRRLMIILLAVIVPWFFLSFFSILKADRFIIPVYPYVAILSALVFDYIKNPRIKLVLVAIALALSFMTFISTDWGKGPRMSPISRPPLIYKITGSEVIEYLEKENIREITALFYAKTINDPLMVYNLYHQAKPVNIVSYLGTTVKDPGESSKILNTVLSSPYILLKTDKKFDKSFPESSMKLLKALAKLFDNDVNLKEYYKEEKRFWIYQDSSELIIYKKKLEVSADEYERLRSKLTEYLK